MPFSISPLPFAYNALEPFIDESTLHFHHDKHQQTYCDKLNAALDGSTEWRNNGIEDILKNISSVPQSIQTAVRNNGGGFYNHELYWKILAPRSSGRPSGELAQVIDKDFGSFEIFKKQFSDSALNRFGSGYAWLCLSEEKLEVLSTANQDCPLSDGKIPLLTIDVWEHSYYLKYQNRRAEYIENFFKIINWKKVEELYSNAGR
ncbi:MAG: superoxide dismutase [Candidatus Diapherotrites archaeon]